MELPKCDDYTKQEQSLVEELKSNCQDNGKEIDLNISARIFLKLGQLHLRCSANTFSIESMVCLIKSAVLLNAALVRTDTDSDDTKLIKQDLNQLFQRLLRAAGAEYTNVDLFAKSRKVKRLVENMRDNVNRRLSEIPMVTKSKSNNKIHQEQDKVKAIKDLMNKITADYTDIMANIAEYCEQIMGKAPCNFAVVGMGSLARKEITPYSDFEHIILLGTNDNYQNENSLKYFKWFSVIFQVIIINLGETIIPSVLNETNSKLGTWFYDDVTTRGICFDAMLPWASKFPLGRSKTRNKPWTTELIKTVPDMLKYLNEDEIIKNGYHLGDILTKTCYVYGDQSLYNEFQSGANGILNKQNENIKTEVLSQIKVDLESFSIRSVLSKISDDGKCNVKKDVYRVTTLFVAALGRLNKISKRSCFEVIHELGKKQAITKNARNKLSYAIALACEIRLKWYMINNRQNDEIIDTNAAKRLLEIVGKTSVIDYFQIAYALQCDISKTFDLKKGHFYSHPDLLNISIYTVFQTIKDTVSYVESFVTNPITQERLLDFDIALNRLQEEKSKSFKKKLLTLTTTDIEQKRSLNKKLRKAAKMLYDTKRYSDSKDCLTKSLKIQKQISLDVDKDESVATTMHEIGICLLQMNKLTEAKEHLEIALQIDKQISHDVDKDESVANTMHSIGRCLLQMNKLTEAKEHLEIVLQIKKQISHDVDKDKSVATIMNEIGSCLLEMNKLMEAKEHLEIALQIDKQISHDVDKDESVATTMHSIDRCLLQMNKLTEAKEHLEIALQIKKQISLDVDKDESVAITMHSIGRCLLKMNKLTEAKEHLEIALQMQKQISLDVDKDKSVANTMHAIGRCLLKMNKLTEAKEHLEIALQIEKQISHDVDKDKSVAITMHEIGRCLLEMNKLTEAKQHLEIALQIKKQISLDVDKDESVAITMHSIGKCLLKMNKLTEAKEHLEIALQIKKQISLDVDKDKSVASTMHSIGRCLLEMNKLTEAKEHLEIALQIEKQISHDVDKDESVASTMHVIGRCLLQMNKLTEAKEHLEIALQIIKQISHDVDKDRSVATTMHSIGRCLLKMNKLTEAKEHLEIALQIKKQISLDVDKDKSVANTMHSIGKCLLQMNKLTEAKQHLEIALQIDKQISHDVDKDKTVANTMHSIGICLLKMNKLTEAKEHLEIALQIKKQISHDVDKDESVASTMHVIGRCLLQMNKLTEAKEHLEIAP